MYSTPFHHPYRMDDLTIQRASAQPGFGNLVLSSQLPENIRFLAIDPSAFTHAYLLLGTHPQRFDDVSFYLSTINTFFERSDVIGGIKIPTSANSDIRKRLCEDLGVGLACYFMVNLFGVTWSSICQIPQNTKLSAKRPDFESFGRANERYLFESKGTTALRSVEPFLSNAIDQVKAYPEDAEARFAVVSYISADERFFPSTTFVVDPPSLPQGIEPDSETAQHLHFEKVLQYIGLTELAKEYLDELARILAEARRDGRMRKVNWSGGFRSTQLQLRLQNALKKHLFSPSSRAGVSLQEPFVGRSIKDSNTGIELFLGVAVSYLERGITFQGPTRTFEDQFLTGDAELTSLFSDGTVLILSRPVE